MTAPIRDHLALLLKEREELEIRLQQNKDSYDAVREGLDAFSHRFNETKENNIEAARVLLNITTSGT
jgi:hypothetical protein